VAAVEVLGVAVELLDETVLSSGDMTWRTGGFCQWTSLYRKLRIEEVYGITNPIQNVHEAIVGPVLMLLSES
jgi:hypothetical protein